MSQKLDIQSIQGLTETEAARKLQQDGFNELPTGEQRSIFRIILEVIKEPMFLLLISCGGIYLMMGSEHIGDAIMLLGFVFVVMGITIVQERRTERALDALRDLSSPRALVIRDGKQRRIAGREVVCGDMMILAEGDRVPADAVLRYSVHTTVNESLLTGESVPVSKSSTQAVIAMPRPGGENTPFIYSGTLMCSGQCVAEVLGTGTNTELGKIGKSLQSVNQEETLLQQHMGKLVRYMAIVGLVCCAIVIVIFALTRGNTFTAWKEGLMVGITMAMATLPEELPVVLTVFLALGAWRISKKRVLTRRMPAIETLGAATVLCSDKTGTLTLNQMSVQQLSAFEGEVFDASVTKSSDLPETFHELLEYGILASKRDPFDPMEKAIRQVGGDFLSNTEHLHNAWVLEQEYPLSPSQLSLSHVWRSPTDNKKRILAAKGAPEAITDLCHLSPERTQAILDRVTRMADQGLRVLGVAKGVFRQSSLPEDKHDLDYTFVGLIGLADPIRTEIPEAIKECYQAGIRVVMITGDYRGTAESIARQIGLTHPDQIITGPELDQMTDTQLKERIGTASIFARVVPEQKLRIVEAFKARGEIVAMTGDGVNDAPALKSAHIGIAMGGRGTDVAREASSLVLLDDDFSSIVHSVRLGRRIFDNIKKAVAYIYAIHVPIAGLSAIPAFFSDWPVILMPVHVVFLELIIDPACSVIFEAEHEEPNVMNRPPRNPKEGLLSKRSLLLSLIQGFSVLAIVLAVFMISRNMGQSEENSRALSFITLLVSNICLILTNRSWSRTILSMFKVPNAALWWVVGGAVGFMTLILNVPFLRNLFHFDQMHAIDLLICLAAGIGSVLWFEILKLISPTNRKH